MNLLCWTCVSAVASVGWKTTKLGMSSVPPHAVHLGLLLAARVLTSPGMGFVRGNSRADVRGLASKQEDGLKRQAPVAFGASRPEISHQTSRNLSYTVVITIEPGEKRSGRLVSELLFESRRALYEVADPRVWCVSTVAEWNAFRSCHAVVDAPRNASRATSGKHPLAAGSS